MKQPTLKNLPGKRRRIPQNTNIWEPEDAADKLYFAENGRVNIVELSRDGSEILLESVKPNEFFGELCFSRNAFEKRRSTARTLTDCTIVEFSVREFTAYTRQNDDWLKIFAASLSRKLSNAERRISILSQRGVEKRLGSALLFLAQTSGIQTNANLPDEVKIFVTHEELAALAAVSRQRVTKTMTLFREIGLIRYNRTEPLVINIRIMEKHLESC